MLIGPKADKATLEAFREKLKRDPRGFIAQPTLALSTVPTLVEEGLAPRHVDLRPVRADRRATGSASCPAASRASPSRPARWWSIRARAAAPRTPGCWTDDAMHARRTADNMYLARALCGARRISRAHPRSDAAPDRRADLLAGATTNEWESARRDRGLRGRLLLRPQAKANEQTVTDFLAFSPDNPSSIRSCFEVARSQCALGAHRAHHGDVGRDQRHLARAAEARHRPASREQFAKFLRWVQESSLRFDGSAYRTMLRNDAYWFSRLGVFIERADNTARILDVKYHLLLPPQEHVGGAARLFPVGRDPALGLGAHRLSLGLSREPETLADRRPADPQRPDAALARELLRASRRAPGQHRARLWPPGPGAAPRALGAHAAAKTAGWRRSSRPACTNSSADFIADNNRLGALIAEQYLL